MYPVKLRKVLKHENASSHEFAPVETIKVKGSWTNFVKELEGNNKDIDYDKLEDFIKGTLESIVLENIQKDNVCVAELEIDTGVFLIYVTTTRNVESLKESHEIFSSSSMAMDDNTIDVVTTGWVNRLNGITSLGVRKLQKPL